MKIKKELEAMKGRKKMTNNMTTDELAAELWDLYKYAYGARPRHITEVQWADREFLVGLWHLCCEELDISGKPVAFTFNEEP